MLVLRLPLKCVAPTGSSCLSSQVAGVTGQCHQAELAFSYFFGSLEAWPSQSFPNHTGSLLSLARIRKKGHLVCHWTNSSSADDRSQRCMYHVTLVTEAAPATGALYPSPDPMDPTQSLESSGLEKTSWNYSHLCHDRAVGG